MVRGPLDLEPIGWAMWGAVVDGKVVVCASRHLTEFTIEHHYYTSAIPGPPFARAPWESEVTGHTLTTQLRRTYGPGAEAEQLYVVAVGDTLPEALAILFTDWSPLQDVPMSPPVPRPPDLPVESIADGVDPDV